MVNQPHYGPGNVRCVCTTSLNSGGSSPPACMHTKIAVHISARGSTFPTHAVVHLIVKFPTIGKNEAVKSPVVFQGVPGLAIDRCRWKEIQILMHGHGPPALQAQLPTLASVSLCVGTHSLCLSVGHRKGCSLFYRQRLASRILSPVLCYLVLLHVSFFLVSPG